MNSSYGCLYIVPTPIGNLKDITLRAIEILRSVDLIACEDTRTAGKLLKLLGLPKKPLLSYYDHNEEEKSEFILTKLKEGIDLALISEAGTPLISDPGYKLVLKCITEGVRVVPLPGATAFIPALVASGLPVNQFKFFGFPPKKKGLKKFIESIKAEVATIVLYVSSHQVIKFLCELSNHMEMERKICIAREITKLNEEFIRGTLGEIITFVNSKSAILKGEFVLIIEGKGSKQCL